MKRYRVGILGVHAAIDYPRSMRLGVQNALEEAGHTLVTICDLVPYHTLTNAEAYVRVACEIAARLDLDAIIYPVGCVASLLSGNNEKALELLQILDPAKTLVLERSIPEYRCITKDNGPGMHECMCHLIEECGFTKIAFVSGPATSHSAKEREAIYFEEMAAHGLETSPDLFARGTFNGFCSEAIEELLDKSPDVEAIACACDLIAYTTYSVMHKRGLTVGEDIAVTGFDDNPRSVHMDPPLSTVRMTSYDLGYLAGQEVLRLCRGLPQQTSIMSSMFVARNSCGESVRGGVMHFRELLRQKPFPTEDFIAILINSTLSMAGPRIQSDFEEKMTTFFDKIRISYIRHKNHPSPDDLLFSSQDLAALFTQDYRQHLSLEGFHNVAITLLEALLEESPTEDATWVIEQISHLHLRIARLLNTSTHAELLRSNKREWISTHTVDDALREDHEPTKAYQLMLEEFVRMGVQDADLFLLPEPLEFAGARQFALSDTLQPLGSLVRGSVRVATEDDPLLFQDLLSHILSRYEQDTECVVSGILAGNELMGVAAIDCNALGDHEQLMAFVSLGYALKHLQMIATERELNELLNKNNLLLQQQSQHDVMTGLLNRRGFMNQASKLLDEGTGEGAAILFMDLDGLKSINDTFGHDSGDEAIRATARILRACASERDVVCRLGGDEFVAFIFARDQAHVDDLIASAQSKMEDFNRSGEFPFRLAMSVGSVLFATDKSTAPALSDLMMQADEHLYEMKRRHKESRRYAVQT